MTAEIKGLFQTNIELLELVDKAVIGFREQRYQEALEYMPVVTEKMRNVVDSIIGDKEYFELVSTDSLMEMLEGIVAASRCEDYVLLADLLELQLCTLLCNVQELIMQKEDYDFFSETMYREQCAAMTVLLKGNAAAVFEKPLDPEELLRKGYRVEVTSCGLMTVAVKTDRGSVYLHTNHKIATEAYLLARSWIEKGKNIYLVKGFGLGYHVMELAKQLPEAEIEVYESDGELLKLACAFSPLKELLQNEKITVCYDEDGSMWKERMDALKENEQVCLHMPSVQAGSALY